MDFISHQAALGSVPRSIADPITSNAVNIDGIAQHDGSRKRAKCKEICICSFFIYLW